MASGVEALGGRRPEWRPWLAVIDEVQRESAGTQWDRAVPEDRGPRQRSVPHLSGASISIEGRAVRDFLRRLLDVASRSATPKMATLKGTSVADFDVAALFAASIAQDDGYVTSLASVSGGDVEALQALVALISVPLLQACNRRWRSSMPTDWMEGYCPLCGSWPAFAEVRGIDRARYLRCARCGGEWHGRILHCAYCGTSDHGQLTTLVPEGDGSSRVVEACRSCHGYVKAFTRLQGCAPAAVMTEDLASVDLDLAALGAGFTRRAGAACRVVVHVNTTESPRRHFAWRT